MLKTFFDEYAECLREKFNQSDMKKFFTPICKQLKDIDENDGCTSSEGLQNFIKLFKKYSNEFENKISESTELKFYLVMNNDDNENIFVETAMKYENNGLEFVAFTCPSRGRLAG